MNAKTRSIDIAASVVLLGAFVVLLDAQSRQGTRREDGRLSNQTARAIITTVSDAPLTLQIAQPETAGVDQYDPEVEIIITNSTNKPVSAYAIRYDVVSSGQPHPGGVELNNISGARFLLQPREARTTTIGGVHYSLPIERIVVSIDFLEFTDGTTWGADTYSSAEVLAGMRAGAHTASRHLLQLLTELGPATFAKYLERPVDVVIPDGHSAKWGEGFQRGTVFIMERTKHEKRDSSAAEVERVLSLPIDAFDEIRRSNR